MDSVKPRVFIWQGRWRGGAEKITLGVGEAFKKYHGISPTLGVLEKREDVDFEQIVVKELFPERLIGYNAFLATWYLNKKGVLDRFDIAFSHGGLFLKTKNNFYVCHEASDLDLLGKNLSPLSRLAFLLIKRWRVASMKKANLIVSSVRGCDRFLERHGIKNYVRSSSFVDTKIFRPIKVPTPSEKFNVLFVGRKDPIKNFKGLRKVCWELKDKVNLYVAGIAIESEANVSYLGELTENELVQWYNRCDLFVLPSFWEGFPFVLLEGLACRTPILASKYAVPEILKEFTATFDPYKKNELKEKILWSIDNYDEMLNMAEKGYKFVIKNYDKEKVLKEETGTIIKVFFKSSKLNL